MKQNPHTSNQRLPINRGLVLVLALIAGAWTLVADAGTSKLSVQTRRDRGEREVDAQAAVTAGAVDANANLDLGGGGAAVSATVTTDGKPKPPGGNDDGHGKGGSGDHGKGGPGDHGKAPVPEPDTWIALATLLVIGSSLAVLERRRKKNQPLLGGV